jgi:acyl carrier protein
MVHRLRQGGVRCGLYTFYSKIGITQKGGITMSEFFSLIAGILEVDASMLTLNTKRSEISSWDSLAHIRMAAELEERLGAHIPIEVLGDIETLGGFYKYLGGS